MTSTDAPNEPPRETTRAVESAELREGWREQPHPRRLHPDHPQRKEILELHAGAVADGLPVYTDPRSGLTVFTAQFLARRGYCCSSGCRHCPYVL